METTTNKEIVDRNDSSPFDEKREHTDESDELLLPKAENENWLDSASKKPKNVVCTVVMVVVVLVVCLSAIAGIVLAVLIVPSQGVYFTSQSDSALQSIIDPVYIGVNETQWIGGDSFASVYVDFGEDHQYSVFLFGDSIFGEIDEDGNRIKVPSKEDIVMVHNLLGIYEKGKTEKIDMKYRYNSTSMQYSSFFSSTEKSIEYPNQTIYFWLMAGDVIDGDDESSKSLFFWTPRVYSIPGKEMFGLEGCGVIRCDVNIENVADPFSWDCQYKNILIGGEINTDINLGYIGNVIEGEYMYLMTNTDDEESMTTSRIKLDDLKDFSFQNLEFFVDPGLWGPYFKSMKLKGIEGLPKTTESTITYNKYMEKYYVIQKSELGTSKIFISDSITGPFESSDLYAIPDEFSKVDDLIYYGFKSHPELCDSDAEIVVSYNTNAWPPDEFFDMFYDIQELVIPQLFRVEVVKTLK